MSERNRLAAAVDRPARARAGPGRRARARRARRGGRRRGHVAEVQRDLGRIKEQIDRLQLESMLSGEADHNDAFLQVAAGAGGTESQDWAEMLLRMYLRWAEQHGYKTEWIEESEGEEAGIKSATVKIVGENAYGWLKTEAGVHRLVRISPFDSNARRHTSFASRLGLAGDRRPDRDRDPGQGPQGRHLPRLGCRRPARQPDRFRRPPDPPADRHRRRLPERPLAAPQPGAGDGYAPGQALRARAVPSAGRSRTPPRRRRWTRPSARRSATTSCIPTRW